MTVWVRPCLYPSCLQPKGNLARIVTIQNKNIDMNILSMMSSRVYPSLAPGLSFDSRFLASLAPESELRQIDSRKIFKLP